MRRVYVDTEYCYPGMTKGQPRPTSDDKRQIVQIAAIIFDTNLGEEISSFDMLVVPPFENHLPSFFVELTGITQADVDIRGVSFKEAISAFQQFCGGLSIWTFDKDEEVLCQNCDYINIAFPFSTSFTRVKGLLSTWGVDPDAYSSGTLYKVAGLDMDGHIHNALHDVRSMARAVYTFESKML